MLATRCDLHYLQYLGCVLAGLGLVDALELDVHIGLRLHVGQVATKRQALMLFVELLDGVGDDPEPGFLLDLACGVSAEARARWHGKAWHVTAWSIMSDGQRNLPGRRVGTRIPPSARTAEIETRPFA